MEENLPKDYSSVEKIVKLPEMRQIRPEESKYFIKKDVFPPVENQLITSAIISEGLKETMISLR